MSEIAKVVRDMRQARDWTQRDLSTASGVTIAVISNIERGVVRPSSATLQRLATAFGEPIPVGPAAA